MELPDVLMEEGTHFSNRQVMIRKQEDGFHASQFGPEMDFDAMQGVRIPISPNHIKYDFGAGGHIFANLGVSAVLTITIGKYNYAILVEQKQEERSVAKLIARYADARMFLHPLEVLENEIAEEFIPFTEEGRVICGMKNLHALPKPFKQVIPYDEDVAYQLMESKMNIVPGLVGPLFIENRWAGDGMYFQSHKNNAQIVFSYHIDFPSLPIRGLDIDMKGRENLAVGDELNYLAAKNASLLHAEGELIDGKVKTIPKGNVLLFGLAGQRLNGWVYEFKDGRLKQVRNGLIGDGRKIYLSSTFAPKDEGIASVGRISFEEYLKP